MSSTLSPSPSLIAQITAALTSGAAPAIGSAAVNHNFTRSVTVGTTAGTASKVYSAAFTVTAGTPLLIDLTSVIDPLGASLTFASVTGLMVTNDSTTAGQDFTLFGGTNPLYSPSSLTSPSKPRAAAHLTAFQPAYRSPHLPR